LDTAKDIYTVLGGNASMLMSFISNPFFGVCLIILGMTGIPAAKSEAMSGQLIPSRQPFGWILFSGLAIIVFSTLWFESYMLSSGALAIREFYIAQHTPREVRKEQLTLIELNVCPFAEEFQPVRVIAVHTTEAMHYAQEFISAFKACPISVIDFGGMDQSFPIPTETADLHRKGLFVAVNNKDAPDARSKAFLEHLLAANIDVKFSQFEGKTPPPPQAPVTLFISDR
jgi:hypothetical protein